MQKVSCLNCGKELIRWPSEINKTNFCSKKCLAEYRTGKKITEEHRINISKATTGDGNGRWKGDLVKMKALHIYVKVRLKKPELCQDCGKVEPYDLANKGIYDRNLDNWEWLCRRCHMIKDGRLKELIERNKKHLISQ